MYRFTPLVLILLLLAAGCQQSQPPHDYGPVGPFQLTERSGRTVTQDDLLGKVWISTFVFTRCIGPCPQVTATAARLQQHYSGNPDVRLVTFTVDPQRDDPKELQRYASNYQADPEQWLFLTGKEEAIHTLLREGFKVGVERNKGEQAKPGDEFLHSTRMVLVDRKGHIRAYFPGLQLDGSPHAEKDFEDSLKALHQTVAALLREEP